MFAAAAPEGFARGVVGSDEPPTSKGVFSEPLMSARGFWTGSDSMFAEAEIDACGCDCDCG